MLQLFPLSPEGILFYDSNGNLAGGSVALATLTTKPLLTAADFQVI